MIYYIFKWFCRKFFRFTERDIGGISVGILGLPSVIGGCSGFCICGLWPFLYFLLGLPGTSFCCIHFPHLLLMSTHILCNKTQKQKSNTFRVRLARHYATLRWVCFELDWLRNRPCASVNSIINRWFQWSISCPQ